MKRRRGRERTINRRAWVKADSVKATCQEGSNQGSASHKRGSPILNTFLLKAEQRPDDHLIEYYVQDSTVRLIKLNNSEKFLAKPHGVSKTRVDRRHLGNTINSELNQTGSNWTGLTALFHEFYWTSEWDSFPLHWHTAIHIFHSSCSKSMS